MRNTKPRVVAAGVVVLALAACGGAGGEEDTSPDVRLSGSAGGQAFDPDRAAPAAPIDGAVPGGTVTVLGSDELATMDPTDAYHADTVSILSGLVTRSLTQYVYDPARQSMVLIPDLATDIGTPNSDFTQWRFTIRDGVRFEDGSGVTAEDVAFGIKRSFDRDNFPEGPTFSNDYFVDGDQYRGPYQSGTSYPGVVVEGDTLTLKMARPFPEMPYWATWPAIGPIPERGSNPATYGRHPLATGPYKFANYSPGKSLTLVQNEQWDPNTDPGRHQYPDRFEFDFTQSPERIDAMILGDSADSQTMLSIQNVLPGDYREAHKLDLLTLGPTPCTRMWNMDNRKITDIRVRQAIGYAVPYQEVARMEGDIFGVTFLAGTSILPPGFPGRQDFNALETEPGQTDPDRSKALLKQAGYAPGEFELRWPYVASDPSSAAVAAALVTALEAAGFRATPFPTQTEQDFFAVITDPQAPVNVRIGGWCPDWPSGNSWFPPVFHSEGEGNFAHLSEPAVDAEIERISGLPVEEQPAEWGDLDETIMTDYYPVVVTGYPGAALLHGSRIAGMNIDSAYPTMPTWKDIFVRQSQAP